MYCKIHQPFLNISFVWNNARKGFELVNAYNFVESRGVGISKSNAAYCTKQNFLTCEEEGNRVQGWRTFCNGSTNYPCFEVSMNREKFKKNPFWLTKIYISLLVFKRFKLKSYFKNICFKK